MGHIFSVVMPLYNVEEYFEEAIDSVIGQTIGIDNIQIILVNDGSTDSTQQLCEYYMGEYPNSVTLINKENGGVSSARNAGIEMIKGKYTLFFDGDDIWDQHAFESIYSFFESKYDEVDVCSCRMKYVGDFVKRHPLDFKYQKGNCVIDLEEHPDYVQATIGNTVFKSSSVREHRFQEAMKYCEDSLFENTIILNRLKIGIVADAVFYYRRTVVSATKAISQTPYWYLNVPAEYYEALINLSQKLHGRTVKYVQAVLVYDIQWRQYSVDMKSILSPDEISQYQLQLTKVLQQIDDQMLISYAAVNQYRKLALLNIKHEKSVLEEAELHGYRYMFRGEQILSLRTFSVLQIQSLVIKNNTLYIEGVIMDHLLSGSRSVCILDKSKREYGIITERYPKKDIFSLFGDCVARGFAFRAEVPAVAGEKYKFVFHQNNHSVVLNPNFSNEVLLSRRIKHSFYTDSGLIIKYINNRICIYSDSLLTRMRSEYRLRKELSKKEKNVQINEYKKRRALIHELQRLRLKPRVAFISNRKNELFLPNLQTVYNAYPYRKTEIAKKTPYSDEEIRRIAKELYQCRVVVTDDYCFFFRAFGKKKGQSFVQIWHAAGAFKKFGLDASSFVPAIEKEYHRNYDLVCVSSEHVRTVYANAFGIPVDRIQALGVPRTDVFFNKKYIKSVSERIYESYSQLLNKRIVLYAPTFRDIPGKPRAYFSPKIDFQSMSNVIPDDTVFVICPHPVMEKRIVGNEYPNIIEIRDFSTNEMMLISDLLITDYSSVIFEYSLLNKPIIFYCYDYDEYDRDFYLDYEKELPGEVFKKQDELFEYIARGNYESSEKMQFFRDRYMGACDGHSTERVLECIKEMNCR